MTTRTPDSAWDLTPGTIALPSQPRRHVGKACERCRQQKIKCNGESPCTRCVRLSIPCIMRRVTRQRAKQPKGPAPPDDSHLIRTALKPVRIKDEATGNTAVYGPTSTTALLYAIASRNRNPEDNQSQGFVDADASIEAFKYHAFFFENYNQTLLQRVSLTPPMCLMTIPNDILQFFLNRYVGTAWLMLPMQSPTQLGGLFVSSYNALSQNSPPPLFHPLLLYQLAMGSLSTMQGELSDMLAQEGELVASGGVYLTPEMELQLNILKIQYYSEIGSFDKAYSLLGHVTSRLYATGLYLEPHSPTVKRLLRVVITRERYICVALGRPLIIGACIQVCEDDAKPVHKFISGLFRICCSALRIQQPQNEKFDQLWNTVWTAHARLKTFWEEQEPILNTLGPEPFNEHLSLNAIMYEYAVLTNLKPLLLYFGYKTSLEAKESSPSISQTDISSSSSSSSSSTLDVSDPRLSTAGEIALSSAKRIISLVCGICERGSIAKVRHPAFREAYAHNAQDLPLNSFHLETACVALISHGVWFRNSPEVWESLDKGIACLESLQYQRAASMRLAGIRAALEQSGLTRM
ncbi:hypothetical protein BJX99DRAFT_138199 [Aspergillus californicus]